MFYGTLLFLALGTGYIVSLLAFSTATNIVAQINAFIQGILALLGLGRRRKRRRRRRRRSSRFFPTLRFSSAMLGRSDRMPGPCHVGMKD